MNDTIKKEIQSAAFERLIKHLSERKDVQSVEKHSALYIEQRMYGFRRYFLANSCCSDTAVCLEFYTHLKSTVGPYLELSWCVGVGGVGADHGVAGRRTQASTAF